MGKATAILVGLLCLLVGSEIFTLLAMVVGGGYVVYKLLFYAAEADFNTDDWHRD